MSRGELIEIGDGFRIPDVLARSGARLVEVGTTNRTRAADYEAAIGPETALLLRVHQSNFRVGRLHRAAAGRRSWRRSRAGTGCRSSTTSARARSSTLEGEPTPAASLAAGADLVCFSGDKLLGGPQAGIVAGRADLVERLRRHPLQRALRADKLVARGARGDARALPRPARTRSRCCACCASRSRRCARAAERLAAAVGGVGRGDGRARRRRRAAARRAAELRLRGRGGARRRAAGRRAAGRRRRPRRPHAARLPHAHGRRGRRGRAGGARMPLTVGTAGHVDHGKTWLVRALTGKDTDRLPEEQARGISIDLGYAPLDLPDGRRLSLVDVPGHERFVRNMVAGATGIDLFLLVIDAGEGARPQTHEHLAILRLLGIERGVVAVTKADAVDAETLELALEEARELVPDAEVVAVSAKTGAGLDELRAALARAADLVLLNSNVDRAVGAGPPLRRPRRSRCAGSAPSPPGRSGRGRSAWATRCAPSRAAARSACAGAGARRAGRARRGRAARRPRAARRRAARAPARRRPRRPGPLPAELPARRRARGARADRGRRAAARPPRHRRRPGARRPGGDGSRSCAWPRRSSPRAATASCCAAGRPSAAARVLDPAPPRHADAARFERAERGEAPVHAPVAGARRAWRFSDEWLEELRRRARTRARRRRPARPRRAGADGALGEGRARAAPVRAARLEALPAGRDAASLGDARGGGRGAGGGARRRGARRGEGRATPSSRATSSARAARPARRRLRRLAAAYERARALVLEECEAAGRISLARFRDLVGCGRRDAQLLLERLDADGVTRRIGDERVLRRTAARQS